MIVCLPIVIDGKCVYYKTVKHTAASEIVFACYEWQEPDGVT